MKRYEAIEVIIQHLKGDELIVSSTGMISRELFTINDTLRNFYMIGSMGLASSIGLGLALSLPDRKVIVLDGDGACLMNLGAMAMIGHLNPPNLKHIILDNGVYGSTGGQRTISDTVILEDIAEATGYWLPESIDNENELKRVMKNFQASRNVLSFVVIHIKNENVKEVERVSHSPEEIKSRFMGVL